MELKLRKSYRIWLCLLVICVFFVFFGELLVDRVLNSAPVKTLIRDKITIAAGITCDYRSIQVSFLPFVVRLHDLKGDNEHQSFRAAWVEADISGWSLFMGEPKIGNLRVEKPVYTLNRQFTPKKYKTGNAAPRWLTLPDPRIERLTVISPEIRLDLKTAKKHEHLLEISGGELEVRFQSRKKLTISASLSQINYLHNQRQRLEAATLDGELIFTDKDFELKIDRLTEKNIAEMSGNFRGIATVDDAGIMTTPLQMQGEGTMQGDLAILDAQLGISRSRGKAESDFKLEMRFPSRQPVEFTASSRVKAEQGIIGGIKIHDSEAHLTVTPQRLLFSQGKLVVGGEPRGVFQGRVDLSAPYDFAFKSDIEHLTFAELMSTFNADLDLFDFAIAGKKVLVTGKSKPFALQAMAEPTVSAIRIKGVKNYRSSPVCHMVLDLHTNKNQLEFKKLSGDCASGPETSRHIAMHGTIGYKSRAVNLAVTAPDLNLNILSFLVAEEMQGRAKLQAEIAGKTSQIVVGTVISATEVAIGKSKVGKVSAALDFHRDFVTWRKAQITPADGGLILSKRGKLIYKQLQFNATLRASDIKASYLKRLLARSKLPLQFGIANLDADLAGYFLHPLAYTGRVRAHFVSLVASKEKLAEELTFTAMTKKRNWQVNIGSLRLPGLTLQGTLTHNRRVPFRVEEFAQAQNIVTRLGISNKDRLKIALVGGKNTQPHRQSFPYLHFFRADFHDVRLTLAGQIRKLRGEISTRLRNIESATMKLPELDVRGDIIASKISFKINNPDETFTATMSVDLRQKNLPFNWQLNFTAFDLLSLTTFADNARNYARLSGRWNLQGHLHNWFAAEGELALDDFRLHYTKKEAGVTHSLSLRQKSPVRILFKRKRWVIAGHSKLELENGQTTLTMSLAADNSPHDLKVNFFGAVDASLLPLFVQEIDVATGYLQLEGNVRGTISNPQVSMSMERLSPLSLSVAGLRPAFNDIDVKVRYKNKELLIEELTAQKGVGSVTMRGKILWPQSNGENYLRIELQNARFIHPILGFKNTELHLNGDLTLRWRELPFSLVGNLTINKASNFSYFDIRKVIVASFRERKYRGGTHAGKPLVNFNLNIDADQALTIENRNMQALLSARLQIQGNNTAPVITGFIKVDKGKFIYRRSFILTHGMISFAGGQQIDPNLDIKAYSEIPPWVVDLTISGKASDPVGELTITPAVRDDGTPINRIEILTLLTRGTLSDPNQVISDTGGAGFSEVANVLVGQFERPLEELLKHSGQDVVSQIFINTYASRKGILYPKLTAPLNLPWRNLDLSLQVDPYTWRLLTEYPIHNSITLSGSISGRSQDDEEDVATQDAANDQAVDLKFNFSIP